MVLFLDVEMTGMVSISIPNVLRIKIFANTKISDQRSNHFFAFCEEVEGA